MRSAVAAAVKHTHGVHITHTPFAIKMENKETKKNMRNGLRTTKVDRKVKKIHTELVFKNETLTHTHRQ